MKAEELLEKICKWYNYNLKIYPAYVVMDNGTHLGTKVMSKSAWLSPEKKAHFEYFCTEDCLKDWLDTLIDTNKDEIANGKNPIWNNEDISFIKSL